MFFKAAVFKRLITKAWKGIGLTVGKDGEYIFLSGGYWVIHMKENKIPNKLKAAIVELTGELPKDGMIFKSEKGVGNQYEMPDKEEYHIEPWLKSEMTEYAVTKLVLEQSTADTRLLQSEEDGSIVLLNQVFIDLVDKDAIQKKEECIPFGPIRPDINEDAIIWYNDTGMLRAYRRSVEDKSDQQDIINVLEKIQVESWVN